MSRDWICVVGNVSFSRVDDRLAEGLWLLVSPASGRQTYAAMWEEDPSYQRAVGHWVIGLIVAGTITLAGICFFVGDLEPIRGWVTGILLLEAAWAAVATAVYALVRAWFWYAERSARSSGRGRNS